VKFNPASVIDNRYFELIDPKEAFQGAIEPLILRGFIPAELCNELILLNANKSRQLTSHPRPEESKRVVDTNYRNTETLSDVTWNEARAYFEPASYKAAINSHWGTAFSYEFLREPVYTVYKPGQYCNTHIDVTVKDTELTFASAEGRRLTAIAYLTEWSAYENTFGKFTGGELIFSSILDDYGSMFSFKPKQGDIVIFPSTPLYQHNVTRVTTGERHTILQWIKLT
jgi:predicted 2-oxoglutarate/Fe(II)-dependent dioxygenase YbiX